MYRKWIITFGGLGLLPGVPGTYASLAAAVVYYLLWLWLGNWTVAVVLALSVLLSAALIAICPWALKFFSAKDPRPVVLDEVVGQWLTLLLVPLAAGPVSRIAMGFFLFRAMDVAKPWPLRRIERLPQGWGVLFDDVAGAVYAAIAVRLLILVTRALLGPGMI